jgi:hypothetical protein
MINDDILAKMPRGGVRFNNCATHKTRAIRKRLGSWPSCMLNSQEGGTPTDVNSGEDGA